MVLNNGLIITYGNVVASGNHYASITLPCAYTKFYSAVAVLWWISDNIPESGMVWMRSNNNLAILRFTTNFAGAQTASFLAIGY